MGLLALTHTVESALIAVTGVVLSAAIAGIVALLVARRTAAAQLEAAGKTARAAVDVAEINRQAQRTLERDKDRRQWRRDLVRPFLEQVKLRNELFSSLAAANAGQQSDEVRAVLDRLAAGEAMPQDIIYRSFSPALEAAADAFFASDRVLVQALRTLHSDAEVDPNFLASLEHIGEQLAHTIPAIYREAEAYIYDIYDENPE